MYELAFFLTLHIEDLNDNEKNDNKMDEDADDSMNIKVTTLMMQRKLIWGDIFFIL